MYPAVSAVNRSPPATATGNGPGGGLSIPAPSRSPPRSFWPHPPPAPAVGRAQVCTPPALIAVKLSPPATPVGEGRRLKPLPPSPSSFSEFRPQQYAAPLP